MQCIPSSRAKANVLVMRQALLLGLLINPPGPETIVQNDLEQRMLAMHFAVSEAALRASFQDYGMRTGMPAKPARRSEDHATVAPQ
jgi:hypothetical protein